VGEIGGIFDEISNLVEPIERSGMAELGRLARDGEARERDVGGCLFRRGNGHGWRSGLPVKFTGKGANK
jgi:hypothetical protein